MFLAQTFFASLIDQLQIEGIILKMFPVQAVLCKLDLSVTNNTHYCETVSEKFSLSLD